MMPNTNAAVDLKYLKIIGNGYSDNTREISIYKNGRQQFSVDIIIEAVDDEQQITPIPIADLKKVILINYDTGAQLSSTFVRSDNWAGYDHINAATSERDITPHAPSTVKLWVHVKPNESAANIKIAAKITIGGIQYVTNNRDAEPGGTVKNSGSNSGFPLKIVAPYRFGVEHFRVDNKGRLGFNYEDGSSSPNRWLYEWQISLVNRNYKIFGSNLPAETVPIPYFSQYTEGKKPYHCLWILPVQRGNKTHTFTLGWHNTGRPNKLDCRIYRENDEGVALAVIEESDSFSWHEYKDKVVEYIDNYGCGHSIMVIHQQEGKSIRLGNP